MDSFIFKNRRGVPGSRGPWGVYYWCAELLTAAFGTCLLARGMLKIFVVCEKMSGALGCIAACALHLLLWVGSDKCFQPFRRFAKQQLTKDTTLTVLSTFLQTDRRGIVAAG